MDKLVEIRNLTKTFNRKVILDQINMEINQGDSIAIIGHNGCGKSTLLKIICGLTKANHGEVKYCRKIKFNYVPERFPKISLTPSQYIIRLGLIEGLTKNQIKEKSSELFERFFMEGMIDTPIKYLSKGSIQKVSVIQAIITKPDILILDEPLSGQDIDSQKVFIELMDKFLKEKVSIVMSCHDDILINALSSTVYEIKDRRLQRKEFSKIENRNYDVLIFIGDKNLEEKYPDIKEKAEKIYISENEIKLIANKDNSNETLKKMLAYGYELRGMYSEDL